MAQPMSAPTPSAATGRPTSIAPAPRKLFTLHPAIRAAPTPGLQRRRRPAPPAAAAAAEPAPADLAPAAAPAPHPARQPLPGRVPWHEAGQGLELYADGSASFRAWGPHASAMVLELVPAGQFIPTPAAAAAPQPAGGEGQAPALKAVPEAVQTAVKEVQLSRHGDDWGADLVRGLPAWPAGWVGLVGWLAAACWCCLAVLRCRRRSVPPPGSPMPVVGPHSQPASPHPCEGSGASPYKRLTAAGIACSPLPLPAAAPRPGPPRHRLPPGADRSRRLPPGAARPLGPLCGAHNLLVLCAQRRRLPVAPPGLAAAQLRQGGGGGAAGVGAEAVCGCVHGACGGRQHA